MNPLNVSFSLLSEIIIQFYQIRFDCLHRVLNELFVGLSLKFIVVLENLSGRVRKTFIYWLMLFELFVLEKFEQLLLESLSIFNIV